MWRQISGYEGYYEVSDDGMVRSVDRYITESTGRKRFLRGSIMKLTNASGRKDSDGYLVVNLHKDHKSSVNSVHVLVANAFIPNPYNKPTVNHKDGNKHNNSVSNLEWASYSENNSHAVDNGLRHPRGVPVDQYTVDGEFVASYKSVTEAARATGFSRGAISHCVHGRSITSSGYIWKPKSEGQTTIPNGSTQEDELLAEAQRPL